MGVDEFREGVNQIDDGSSFSGWWRACCEIEGGRRLFLGLYATKKEAEAFYERARRSQGE